MERRTLHMAILAPVSCIIKLRLLRCVSSSDPQGRLNTDSGEAMAYRRKVLLVPSSLGLPPALPARPATAAAA